ncbi:MAG: hypothetical protein AB7P99_17845 [Vicinamibacterales bacterium]
MSEWRIGRGWTDAELSARHRRRNASGTHDYPLRNNMADNQPPPPSDPRDRDDDTPDTPPTEMPPVPIQDPPPDSEPPGPLIS